ARIPLQSDLFGSIFTLFNTFELFCKDDDEQNINKCMCFCHYLSVRRLMASLCRRLEDEHIRHFMRL
ncbi:hypothetical protein NL389_37815, partial [Klebsiella pneumoniae]|nr:hypothetical protein [Klebsiella pneumoniae]